MRDYYITWFQLPANPGSWLYREPNRLKAALRAMKAEGWTRIEIFDLQFGTTTRIEARP